MNSLCVYYDAVIHLYLFVHGPMVMVDFIPWDSAPLEDHLENMPDFYESSSKSSASPEAYILQ